MNQNTSPYTKYQHNPLAYAHDVLGVHWWGKQQQIAEALLRPPHRVLVKASHNVGKTFLAAGLVNWWFDSYAPGIALTTAPTERQVYDLLWKEIRVQRRDRGGFSGPRMARLEHAPDHFAHGFTARNGDRFQGHHSEHMLIVFDEAVGVDPIFWETAESMFSGAGHAWLAIFNPTDMSSQAYQEELNGNWHVISMSVLEHPNILAELAGEAPPYPAAIRLERVDTLLRQWSTAVREAPRANDVEWPPGSNQWLRPGPIAEARLLGRWPSQQSHSVWAEAALSLAETSTLAEPDEPVQIGCDVARFGDDYTAIHVRRGGVSLHHESMHGWNTSATAGRLRQLADQWGRYCGIDGRRVQVIIDDDGVGGGVVDQAEGYRFTGLSGASQALDPELYPNRRSELWFTVAQRAEERALSLARLDRSTRQELRRQALAPTWRLDSRGRRVVEAKADTKKRLRRSPDDMDALNLAYARVARHSIAFC
ncbi:MAG: hypothetical protein HC837_21410 [Chloroflexaceae bacterium]|nr:hypothetical protein [Chloroflexaceae bacterium]